jgi:hypothetical protein
VAFFSCGDAFGVGVLPSQTFLANNCYQATYKVACLIAYNTYVNNHNMP